MKINSKTQDKILVITVLDWEILSGLKVNEFINPIIRLNPPRINPNFNDTFKSLFFISFYF